MNEDRNNDEGEKTPELQKLTDFDVQTALYRMGGSEELYIELLTEFSNEYTDTAEKYQELIKDEDKEPARRLVHTIKGVAGNLGMTRLHRAAANLEKAVKEERFPDTPPLFQAFDSSLTSAFNAIETSGLKDINFGEDKAKTEFKKESAIALLKKFTVYAENRQPKPANEVLKELSDLDWPEEYMQMFEEIVLMAKHYKMKEAAQSSSRLESKIEGKNYE